MIQITCTQCNKQFVSAFPRDTCSTACEARASLPRWRAPDGTEGVVTPFDTLANCYTFIPDGFVALAVVGPGIKDDRRQLSHEDLLEYFAIDGLKPSAGAVVELVPLGNLGNTAAVTILEEWLERARSGEIVALALIAQTTDRCTATQHCIGEGDLAVLNFALDRMKQRLLDEDGTTP